MTVQVLETVFIDTAVDNAQQRAIKYRAESPANAEPDWHWFFRTALSNLLTYASPEQVEAWWVDAGRPWTEDALGLFTPGGVMRAGLYDFGVRYADIATGRVKEYALNEEVGNEVQ